MKTLAEIKSWLKTPEHIRRILVEVTGVTDLSGSNATTFYLSNGGYTSSSTDSPANKAYIPCIQGGVNFTESFSLDGTLTRGIGDLELYNIDGVFDVSFKLIWVKKAITIYLGDPSWPKADFKVLFRGYIKDIASRDRNSFNIVIVDTLSKLDTTLSEISFVNSYKNDAIELIPVCFGECFNITPVLVDPAPSSPPAATTGAMFQVHTTAIEDIIEVRDNGLPVASFTKYLADGKFQLDQNSYGQITCSVQGSKPGGTYTNKIGETIKNIVKNFGPSNSRLTDSDIDLTNFTAFDNNFAVARPIGFYSNQKENILDVCNKLASSVNAKVTTSVGPQDDDSLVGLLRLVKLDISNSPEYEITSSDIEEFSINISEKVTVRAATNIAYCKNWTLQPSGLAEGIPPNNIPLFNSEWLYITTQDNTVVNNYSLTTQPDQENTLLISKAGASAESSARNQLWSTPRFIYTMTAYPHMFFVQLGDCVTLKNRRFDLVNGKVGTVISVSRDWISGRIEIGVIV